MNTSELHGFFDEYRKPLLAVVAALALIIAAVMATDLRQAQVTLTVPVPGSVILVNSTQHVITSTPLQEVTLSLTPGQHTLLVAADDRYPWTKEIILSPGESEQLTVFTFRQESLSERVPTDDPAHEYNVSAEPIQRVVSGNENIELLSDGTTLTANWIGKSSDMLSAFCFEGTCRETIVILESVREIGDIGFYDDEGRVALFESAGNIYALELNTEGTQNFQPLYVGTSPRLIPSEEGIYVRDEDRVLRIAP